jgi:hypothetical protein
MDSSYNECTPPMVRCGLSRGNTEEVTLPTEPSTTLHGADGTQCLAEVSWCKSESSSSGWSTCSSSNSFASVERALRGRRRDPLEQLKGLICNATGSAPPLLRPASTKNSGARNTCSTAVRPLAAKPRGLLSRNVQPHGICVKVTADVSAADRACLGSAESALRGWSNGSDSTKGGAQHMTPIAVAPISDLTASPFAAAVGKRNMHQRGVGGARNTVKYGFGFR